MNISKKRILRMLTDSFLAIGVISLITLGVLTNKKGLEFFFDYVSIPLIFIAFACLFAGIDLLYMESKKSN